MGNAAATIIAADVATGSAASRAARGPKDAMRKDANRSASSGTAAESRVEIARPARASRSNAVIVATAAVRRASRANRVNRVNRAVRLGPRFAARAAAMRMAKDVEIAVKAVVIVAKAGNSRIARRARRQRLASKASRKDLSP